MTSVVKRNEDNEARKSSKKLWGFVFCQFLIHYDELQRWNSFEVRSIETILLG